MTVPDVAMHYYQAGYGITRQSCPKFRERQNRRRLLHAKRFPEDAYREGSLLYCKTAVGLGTQDQDLIITHNDRDSPGNPTFLPLGVVFDEYRAPLSVDFTNTRMA